MCLSIDRYLCLFVCLLDCLSAYPSVCLSASLSFSQFVCLSVCQIRHLCLPLSVCLSVCHCLSYKITLFSQTSTEFSKKIATAFNALSYTVPGMCSVYGNGHFSTFDNKAYNFYGTCAYKLVYDKNAESTFSVVLQQDAHCGINAPCNKSIVVEVDGQTVYLRQKRNKEHYVAMKLNGVEKRIEVPHTKTLPSITVVSILKNKANPGTQSSVTLCELRRFETQGEFARFKGNLVRLKVFKKFSLKIICYFERLGQI